MSEFRLESPSFPDQGGIPKKHTRDGEDLSPVLRWSCVPPSTQELALVCEDPDAPNAPWIHWLVYKIPPALSGLPEGLPKVGELEDPAGVIQGKSSFEEIGYGGPYPPKGDGPHRYYFVLYALDTKLSLPPGATKDELLEAIRGHVEGETELVGRYERGTKMRQAV